MRRSAMAEYPLGHVDGPAAGLFDPVGAYLNYRGSKKAAAAQVQSAGMATDVQKEMFDQTRADQMPWLKAGEGGLNAYAQMIGLKRGDDGSFTYDPSGAGSAMMEMDPGYQFRMKEGQRALDNSAAARGGALSGNAIRAATRYGQDYGSNEYANILSRFGGLAGIGQDQANTIGSARTSLANNVGNNIMDAGRARASGYAALPNAYGGMKDELFKGVGMILGGGR